MDNSQHKDLVLYCSKKEDLSKIAKKIFSFSKKNKIWVFEGELGAGKTTLIKEICNLLGVEDEVSSPSFSIINEYLSQKKPVYHFDFFRIKNVEEAIDLGVSEYLYSGNYCFIEWAQKIEKILPNQLLLIKISNINDEERVFKLSKHE